MDAASNDFNVRFYAGFLDGLDMSVWYANSICDDTFTPVLWYVPSTVSLLLLAMLMKNDNEGTLITTRPLEWCARRATWRLPLWLFVWGPV